MVAIELENVSVSYSSPAGAAGQVERLHALSLSLPAGELCALLGPNGAGKSTIIRLIAGLLEPSSGQLRMFGKPASSLARDERARQVAVVPQHNEVALGFTVGEVVAMGRAPHQGALMRATKDDDEAVASAVDTCQLDGLMDRPVVELSGGEQKRVHIARALAGQAPVLLLDEAAAHLDIKHSIALYGIVREQVSSRRLACLAAMHDLNAAAQHADRVVLLKEGRKVADGPVDEVMTAELLGDTFDVDIEVAGVAGGQRFFVARAPRIST